MKQADIINKQEFTMAITHLLSGKPFAYMDSNILQVLTRLAIPAPGV
jgi:hypothetical protein